MRNCKFKFFSHKNYCFISVCFKGSWYPGMYKSTSASYLDNYNVMLNLNFIREKLLHFQSLYYELFNLCTCIIFTHSYFYLLLYICDKKNASCITIRKVVLIPLFFSSHHLIFIFTTKQTFILYIILH